jgi:outer membrane protein W
MRYFRVVAAVIFVCIAGSAYAQTGAGTKSLGIRISTPQATVNNAVTFRYFFSDAAAVEALVGVDPWSVAGLYERFFPTNVTGLSWYAGGGAYVAFRGDNAFGAAGIIGLDYTLPSVPINMSVDWKPELNLVNNVNFEASALALSVRFVF